MQPNDRRLSWPNFLVIFPLLLFYTYLLGCFSHAILREPVYKASDFPYDDGWLHFGTPVAAFISMVVYLGFKRVVTASSLMIVLVFFVPCGSVAIVQIILSIFCKSFGPGGP